MKITIITVGNPQLSFAKEGIAEYQKRISRFADLSLVHVKENMASDKKILDHIGNDFCIVLDEIGNQYSTQGLSTFLEKQKNQSRNISFVIGGPDGHSDEIRQRADSLWSLSQLTFPHDIAIMLVIETLYRSLSFSAGHPYHRE